MKLIKMSKTSNEDNDNLNSIGESTTIPPKKRRRWKMEKKNYWASQLSNGL
jgi:hypothetical protein